jgi:hypothetical protein
MEIVIRAELRRLLDQQMDRYEGGQPFGVLEIETRHLKGPALRCTGLPLHNDNQSIIRSALLGQVRAERHLQ